MNLPYAITRDDSIPTTYKTVLSVTLSHVGIEGHPLSHGTIAKEARVSIRTVIRASQWLVERGLLSREKRFIPDRRGRLANHYAPGPVVTSCHEGGDTVSRGVVTQSHNKKESSFKETSLKEKHSPSPDQTQTGWRSDEEGFFEKRRDEVVDGAEPLAEDTSSSSRQMVAAEASSTNRAREAEPVTAQSDPKRDKLELELVDLLVFDRPGFRDLPKPGDHGPQVLTAWAKARECKAADGLTAELRTMAEVDSSRSLLEALTDLCCDVEVTEGGTADGEQFARGSVEREA